MNHYACPLTEIQNRQVRHALLLSRSSASLLHHPLSTIPSLCNNISDGILQRRYTWKVPTPATCASDTSHLPMPRPTPSLLDPLQDCGIGRPLRRLSWSRLPEPPHCPHPEWVGKQIQCSFHGRSPVLRGSRRCRPSLDLRDLGKIGVLVDSTGYEDPLNDGLKCMRDQGRIVIKVIHRPDSPFNIDLWTFISGRSTRSPLS
jgi:hypothetical protein